MRPGSAVSRVPSVTARRRRPARAGGRRRRCVGPAPPAPHDRARPHDHPGRLRVAGHLDGDARRVRRPRRARPLRLGVQRLLPRQPPRRRHRRAAGRPAGHGPAVRPRPRPVQRSGSSSAASPRRWACSWPLGSAQGIGAGAIPAVAYTSVGRAYPAALRPRVFAVFASAWVIPGLLGPAASSGLAHAFGWRSVFLALLPLVVLAALITAPCARALGRHPRGPGRRRRQRG